MKIMEATIINDIAIFLIFKQMFKIAADMWTSVNSVHADHKPITCHATIWLIQLTTILTLTCVYILTCGVKIK